MKFLQHLFLTFDNISIRYKLLTSFLIVFVVFGVFAGYFLFRIGTVDSSFQALIDQSKKIQLFLKLQSDNQQLSDALKSYILTKNPTWEATYNTTSVDFSQTLTVLKSIAMPGEKMHLTQFETLSNQIIGTELLILEKTKEGDTQRAIALFDNNYEKQQIEATNIISTLTKGEDNAFFATLQQDNADLNTIRTILFGISAFVLFITTGTAIVISSLIERSIRTLIQGASRLAEGNLLARVPITSHDEIGNLANTFNTMAEKLQVSYAELEQKIQERTAELEQSKHSLELQVQERTADLQKAKDTLELLVADRTQKLENQLSEVKRMNDTMVGRELKMVELKQQIQKLQAEKAL